MVRKITLILLFNLALYGAFSQGIPCPAIDAGADVTICNGQCTKLLAGVNTNYITTTYSVSQIAFTPYPFTGTPILVNNDDIWSAKIDLGFNFCYFGNTYRKVIIGANGQISFDTTKASLSEPWQITKPIPDSTNGKNTISIDYRDINPSISGKVFYQTVGAAPCRALIITWDSIPLFSSGTSGTCNAASFSTFQGVLYETTNIIDVYTKSSFACPSWNGGYGIIGIQNANATVGYAPPTRNYPATWTATNEAWRFSPNAAPSYTVTWFDPGGPIATGLSATVCPTTNTTYTSKMTITNCDGSILNYTDSLKVKVNSISTSTAVISASSATVCLGSSTTLTVSGGSVYSWSPGSGLNKDTGAVVIATPSATTIYTVTGSAGSCADTSLFKVTVFNPPVLTVNIVNDTICNGSSTVMNVSGASSYSWAPSSSLSSSTGSSVTASPTVTTIYTVTAVSTGCIYPVTKRRLLTIVKPITAASITTTTICPGTCSGTAYVTATGGLNNHYSWSNGATTQSISSLCAGTYSVQVSDIYCSSTFTSTANITAPPAIVINPTIVGSSCAVGNNGSISVAPSGGNGAPYTFALNTGTFSSTSYFSNLAAGNYTVSVKDKNGCAKSMVVNVPQSATNAPAMKVSSDTICAGSSVTLVASGASTYTWIPSTFLSATSGATVTATPTTSINYTVAGTDSNGCKNADISTVMVVNSYTVFSNGVSVCTDPNTEVTFYNSFSPNGDGLNDVFEIDNIDKHMPNHVYIYNRWGQLLWDKKDYNNISVVWDGKDNSGNALAPGTYFYLIEIDGKKTEKHWVELTR